MQLKLKHFLFYTSFNFVVNGVSFAFFYSLPLKFLKWNFFIFNCFYKKWFYTHPFIICEFNFLFFAQKIWQDKSINIQFYYFLLLKRSLYLSASDTDLSNLSIVIIDNCVNCHTHIIRVKVTQNVIRQSNNEIVYVIFGILYSGFDNE